MVNENNLINLVNNKKPVELVQELKDEYKIPTYEEFIKTYDGDNLNYDDLNDGSVSEAKGYGPCKKSYCKCSCDKNICNCEWDVEDWMGESGCERYGFLRTSGKAKAWRGEDGKFKNGTLDADGSFSAVATKNRYEEARFFGLSAGGSASLNKEDGTQLKVKLGIDAYNFKDEDKEIRLGFNVDTGLKTYPNGDGGEFKVAGFGISSGNGKVGISTPLFEAKCVVQ